MVGFESAEIISLDFSQTHVLSLHEPSTIFIQKFQWFSYTEVGTTLDKKFQILRLYQERTKGLARWFYPLEKIEYIYIYFFLDLPPTQ